MAHNLLGFDTTRNLADTANEHLSKGSYTGGERFKSMIAAQKGNNVWNTLKSTLGGYGLVLRQMLTKRMR